MTFRPLPAHWPALLFLALFTGLFLMGCQANDDPPWATVEATIAGSTAIPAETIAPATAAPAIPTASATARPTSALQGQSIEFWHPWQAELAKQVEAAAVEFNRTNGWGITVKARPYYSSGALADAVAAGLKDKTAGLPQVVAAPGEQLAAWSVRDDAVIALDGFLKDPHYGLSEEEMADFTPSFWMQDQVAGRQVGIPGLRSARVIFYNESWAKELGFSGPPKTPAEFKTQACAAAQKNNTSGYLEKYGTGGWMIDNDAMTTLSWLGVFGAQPVDGSAGKPYAFQGKEAEEALVFLRDMLDNGCAWLARNPAPYEYFAKRMTLFYSGTLQDLYVQTRWLEKSKSKDSWKILPYMGTDGKPLVYANGYSYAIFRSTPDTEMAAWLFIRWLEEADIAMKLVEAMPSLPVSRSQAAQLDDSSSLFPWNMILPLAEPARPAPTHATWLEAHRLVEDAAWQIYRIPVEELLQILPQLDQAILDVTTNK